MAEWRDARVPHLRRVRAARDLDAVAAALRASGAGIADLLDTQPGCRYTTAELHARLQGLLGKELAGANRSRSLHAKRMVAEALGYDAPKSFKRSIPRFPGMDLDVYVQASDNLQVWNQQLSPERRYAILRPEGGKVAAVRVVTGAELAALDRTGTLTGKRQARRRPDRSGSRLVGTDTPGMAPYLGSADAVVPVETVGEAPMKGQVLPIEVVHERLQRLVGQTFEDPGEGQERRRGEALQRLVVGGLQVGGYHNPAQWPDVTSQALEVKLQTASTIDLGSIEPESTVPVGGGLECRDIRWAVVYAEAVPGGLLQVVSVVTTSGARFYDEFQPFGGNGTNRKLQLRLPADFFTG